MKKRSGKPSALRLLFYSGTVLLLLAIAISVVGLATGLFNANDASLAFTVCFSLLLSFSVISYLLHKGKKPKAIIKELGLSKKAFNRHMVAYGILLFLIYIAIILAIAIFSRFTGVTVNSNVQQAIGGYPVWALIFISIIAPLNEEIAFRGFLVPRIGVVLSGIIFAILHLGYGSVSEIAVALWFGLSGGYVFKKTKSLYPSLMTHILVNVITAISIFAVVQSLGNGGTGALMDQQIKIVAVEPKYQQNLGYIARAMKNFGIADLVLVNPRCDHKGGQAIRYSKHAKEILIKAKVSKSLKSASKGFVVGTTGMWRKADSSFYNISALSELRNKAAWKRSKQITIVLGRDDIGLGKEELRDCDALVFIGTNEAYPVLNISHALAIMLYEFTMPEFMKKYDFSEFYADDKYQKRLIGLFDSFISKNASIRDKKAVSGAFRRILKRSAPTKTEINAIAVALSRKK